MAERVHLIRKLFKASNNNAENNRLPIQRRQRNKVQNKRKTINAKNQVIKALQPYKSTKVTNGFHVTKKRLTKPLRGQLAARDIFKEPLQQASEGFCKKELKYIHESRQLSEDCKSFMDVLPIRNAANKVTNNNWSSHLDVDSPSNVPSTSILELSKSDEDNYVDHYSRFNPKATSTVQQDKVTVKPNVLEVDGEGYADFATSMNKGVLEDVGSYLTLGYYTDTKGFLQEVYKESCKRKLSEERLERENVKSADITMDEIKTEKLTLSPLLTRARENKMSLNSHRHKNSYSTTTCNFMTPSLFSCSLKTVEVESSPEVYHTPAASPTPLVVSPVQMVTLNADVLLKKCSNKGSNLEITGKLDCYANDQHGYTNSLNTSELRCSHTYGYSKLHHSTSHLPNTLLDNESFRCDDLNKLCGNEMHQYCINEQDLLNARKQKMSPIQHDASLMAYNDMSLALQMPVKYKNEDTISLPCSHCRGRGIQIIPVNSTHSSFTIPRTPEIKYFPRKTYREEMP